MWAERVTGPREVGHRHRPQAQEDGPGGWHDGWQSSPNWEGSASFRPDQRLEELNQYIRQQAQEYMESHAEWSRQMAEVRSEKDRVIERVRREKEEVERQARQEVLRLRKKLRDAGFSDEAMVHGSNHSDDHISRNPVTHWGVGLEEHQEVRSRATAAEERVRELESYIKEQAAKQVESRQTEALLKEREEENQSLNSVVQQLQTDLQQAQAELSALSYHHHHKVAFWEESARHILRNADTFLTYRGSHRGDSEEVENRFAQSATKLWVMLPETEGAEMSELQQGLKDALKIAKKGGSKGRSSASECSTAAPGSAAAAENTEGGGTTPEEPDAKEEEVPSQSAPLADGEVLGPGPAAAPGDSDPVPDASPARGGSLRIVGRNGVRNHGPIGPAPSARSEQFIKNMAMELRQILGASQQAEAPPAVTAGGNGGPPLGQTPLQSPEASPRSMASPMNAVKSCEAQEAEARIQQLQKDLLHARRGAAKLIIAAEKLLRGLEMDLRNRCKELLGSDVSNTSLTEGAGDDPAQPTGILQEAAELEAKENLPLHEDGQLQSLVGLRMAQWNSSAALAEFVQLPGKLKVIFDLMKSLGLEAEAACNGHRPRA